MANQETNNLVESVVDTQKKVLDTVVENTRKFTNGNELLNDSIEKGSEWYKNWLDSQRNFFTKTTETASAATENAKENTSKMNEFYENWMNTQMGWAKQIWDTNQEWLKTTTSNTSANPYINWQNTWASMNNQLNGWMNTMNPGNWMNQAANTNPFNMTPFNMDGFKTASNNWTSVVNQFYGLMNNSMNEWQRNLSNSTTKDAYRSMVNIGEGFTKFAEMWMPMFRSMQDKTFNMDIYRKMMNPEMYKEMMDKYFGFMPENNKNYFQNMMNMMNDAGRQMGTSGMNNYNYFRHITNNMGLDGQQMLHNMQNAYSNWQNMMSDAAAPFTKMMTPTQQTKNIQEWGDILNRIAVYNIKNAELQYMIYTNGVKVMDMLAENISKKVQNGDEVTSMISLYQEWLNISDKAFVNLFESEEYSQLMTEVGSMQMKLRKDIELQTEKMIVNLPIATRSDLDELYKAIYDLKGQVRQLQNMMEIDNESKEEGDEEKAAKRSKKA